MIFQRGSSWSSAATEVGGNLSRLRCDYLRVNKRVAALAVGAMMVAVLGLRR
jgi:hypothetical protein